MTLAAISQLLDTHDVDEARTTIAAGYCDHDLRVIAAGSRLHAVQTEYRVGHARLHRLGYGLDVEIHAAPLRSSVLVSSPVRGTLTVETGGAEYSYGPGEVVAIGPDEPFRLRWEGDCELNTVQVDQALVASVVGEDMKSRYRFEAQHRAAPEHAIVWQRVIAVLSALADSHVCTDLIAQETEALVLTSTLSHHARAVEAPDDRAGTSADIRRVIDYIHANAHHPITPVDMASVGHMSVRALQYSLRRQLAMSPSELVRSIRLDLAHEALLTSDPSSTTVATVAHRFGFGNLGRFAQAYLSRFGKRPGQTLRDSARR